MQSAPPPGRAKRANVTLGPRLYAGSRGEVFIANTGNGKRLAVKVVDREHQDSRIEQEAFRRLAADSKPHHNIVALKGMHRSSQHDFLLLELCDYDLLKVIPEGKGLSEQACLYYFSQLLRAVRYSHKHRVFHGDIKPENVLIKLESMTSANGSVSASFAPPPAVPLHAIPGLTLLPPLLAPTPTADASQLGGSSSLLNSADAAAGRMPSYPGLAVASSTVPGARDGSGDAFTGTGAGLGMGMGMGVGRGQTTPAGQGTVLINQSLVSPVESMYSSTPQNGCDSAVVRRGSGSGLGAGGHARAIGLGASGAGQGRASGGDSSGATPTPLPTPAFSTSGGATALATPSPVDATPLTADSNTSARGQVHHQGQGQGQGQGHAAGQDTAETDARANDTVPPSATGVQSARRAGEAERQGPLGGGLPDLQPVARGPAHSRGDGQQQASAALSPSPMGGASTPQGPPPRYMTLSGTIIEPGNAEQRLVEVVKLCDFGSASLTERSARATGSLSYLAPEVYVLLTRQHAATPKPGSENLLGQLFGNHHPGASSVGPSTGAGAGVPPLRGKTGGGSKAAGSTAGTGSRPVMGGAVAAAGSGSSKLSSQPTLAQGGVGIGGMTGTGTGTGTSHMKSGGGASGPLPPIRESRSPAATSEHTPVAQGQGDAGVHVTIGGSGGTGTGTGMKGESSSVTCSHGISAQPQRPLREVDQNSVGSGSTGGVGARKGGSKGGSGGGSTTGSGSGSAASRARGRQRVRAGAAAEVSAGTVGLGETGVSHGHALAHAHAAPGGPTSGPVPGGAGGVRGKSQSGQQGIQHSRSLPVPPSSSSRFTMNLSSARYDAAAADVWSLGVLLYVMLSGTSPWLVPWISDPGFAALQAGTFQWPQHLSGDAVSMLRRMLCIEPESRIRLEDLLRQPWVTQFPLIRDALQRQEQKQQAKALSRLVRIGGVLPTGPGVSANEAVRRLQRPSRPVVASTGGAGAAASGGGTATGSGRAGGGRAEGPAALLLQDGRSRLLAAAEVHTSLRAPPSTPIGGLSSARSPLVLLHGASRGSSPLLDTTTSNATAVLALLPGRSSQQHDGQEHAVLLTPNRLETGPGGVASTTTGAPVGEMAPIRTPGRGPLPLALAPTAGSGSSTTPEPASTSTPGTGLAFRSGSTSTAAADTGAGGAGEQGSAQVGMRTPTAYSTTLSRASHVATPGTGESAHSGSTSAAASPCEEVVAPLPLSLSLSSPPLPTAAAPPATPGTGTLPRLASMPAMMLSPSAALGAGQEGGQGGPPELSCVVAVEGQGQGQGGLQQKASWRTEASSTHSASTGSAAGMAGGGEDMEGAPTFDLPLLPSAPVPGPVPGPSAGLGGGRVSVPGHGRRPSTTTAAEAAAARGGAGGKTSAWFGTADAHADSSGSRAGVTEVSALVVPAAVTVAQAQAQAQGEQGQGVTASPPLRLRLPRHDRSVAPVGLVPPPSTADGGGVLPLPPTLPDVIATPNAVRLTRAHERSGLRPDPPGASSLLAGGKTGAGGMQGRHRAHSEDIGLLRQYMEEREQEKKRRTAAAAAAASGPSPVQSQQPQLQQPARRTSSPPPPLPSLGTLGPTAPHGTAGAAVAHAPLSHHASFKLGHHTGATSGSGGSGGSASGSGSAGSSSVAGLQGKGGFPTSSPGGLGLRIGVPGRSTAPSAGSASQHTGQHPPSDRVQQQQVLSAHREEDMEHALPATVPAHHLLAASAASATSSGSPVSSTGAIPSAGPTPLPPPPPPSSQGGESLSGRPPPLGLFRLPVGSTPSSASVPVPVPETSVQQEGEPSMVASVVPPPALSLAGLSGSTGSATRKASTASLPPPVPAPLPDPGAGLGATPARASPSAYGAGAGHGLTPSGTSASSASASSSVSPALHTTATDRRDTEVTTTGSTTDAAAGAGAGAGTDMRPAPPLSLRIRSGSPACAAPPAAGPGTGRGGAAGLTIHAPTTSGPSTNTPSTATGTRGGTGGGTGPAMLALHHQGRSTGGVGAGNASNRAVEADSEEEGEEGEGEEEEEEAGESLEMQYTKFSEKGTAAASSSTAAAVSTAGRSASTSAPPHTATTTTPAPLLSASGSLPLPLPTHATPLPLPLSGSLSGRLPLLAAAGGATGGGPPMAAAQHKVVLSAPVLPVAPVPVSVLVPPGAGAGAEGAGAGTGSLPMRVTASATAAVVAQQQPWPTYEDIEDVGLDRRATPATATAPGVSSVPRLAPSAAAVAANQHHQHAAHTSMHHMRGGSHVTHSAPGHHRPGAGAGTGGTGVQPGLELEDVEIMSVAPSRRYHRGGGGGGGEGAHHLPTHGHYHEGGRAHAHPHSHAAQPSSSLHAHAYAHVAFRDPTQATDIPLDMYTAYLQDLVTQGMAAAAAMAGAAGTVTAHAPPPVAAVAPVYAVTSGRGGRGSNTAPVEIYPRGRVRRASLPHSTQPFTAAAAVPEAGVGSGAAGAREGREGTEGGTVGAGGGGLRGPPHAHHHPHHHHHHHALHAAYTGPDPYLGSKSGGADLESPMPASTNSSGDPDSARGSARARAASRRAAGEDDASADGSPVAATTMSPETTPTTTPITPAPSFLLGLTSSRSGEAERMAGVGVGGPGLLAVGGGAGGGAGGRAIPMDARSTGGVSIGPGPADAYDSAFTDASGSDGSVSGYSDSEGYQGWEWYRIDHAAGQFVRDRRKSLSPRGARERDVYPSPAGGGAVGGGGGGPGRKASFAALNLHPSSSFFSRHTAASGGASSSFSAPSPGAAVSGGKGQGRGGGGFPSKSAQQRAREHARAQRMRERQEGALAKVRAAVTVGHDHALPHPEPSSPPGGVGAGGVGVHSSATWPRGPAGATGAGAGVDSRYYGVGGDFVPSPGGVGGGSPAPAPTAAAAAAVLGADLGGVGVRGGGGGPEQAPTPRSYRYSEGEGGGGESDSGFWPETGSEAEEEEEEGLYEDDMAEEGEGEEEEEDDEEEEGVEGQAGPALPLGAGAAGAEGLLWTYEADDGDSVLSNEGSLPPSPSPRRAGGQVQGEQQYSALGAAASASSSSSTPRIGTGGGGGVGVSGHMPSPASPMHMPHSASTTLQQQQHRPHVPASGAAGAVQGLAVADARRARVDSLGDPSDYTPNPALEAAEAPLAPEIARERLQEALAAQAERERAQVRASRGGRAGGGLQGQGAYAGSPPTLTPTATPVTPHAHAHARAVVVAAAAGAGPEAGGASPVAGSGRVHVSLHGQAPRQLPTHTHREAGKGNRASSRVSHSSRGSARSRGSRGSRGVGGRGGVGVSLFGPSVLGNGPPPSSSVGVGSLGRGQGLEGLGLGQGGVQYPKPGQPLSLGGLGLGLGGLGLGGLVPSVLYGPNTTGSSGGGTESSRSGSESNLHGLAHRHGHRAQEEDGSRDSLADASSVASGSVAAVGGLLPRTVPADAFADAVPPPQYARAGQH